MKKRQSQLQLSLGQDHARRTEHGGAIRVGKRKLARPIDPKRPMHLVMRAEKARGFLSFLSPRNTRRVRAVADQQAAHHGVRIYQYANSGNHLHLVVRARTRRGMQAFLRTFSGKVAQLVTGARKGTAFGKFWDGTAYTRVAEWGREFRTVVNYVAINELEAAGIFGFRKRPKTRGSP